MPTAPATERGFSLVELVVAIAVLGVALIVVAESLQFGSRHSADPLWQGKTVALVQAYSDEIKGKRYDERTPVGGVPPCVGIGASTAQCTPSASFGALLAEESSESRESFDDLDDFHGLDEAPRSVEGGSLDEYGGYRVQVAVRYAGAALGVSDYEVKAVTLTVTPPGQSPLRFSFYRGNF